MSDTNGNGVYASDELEHDDVPEASGFLIPGHEVDYDGDWDIDLKGTVCPDQIPADYKMDARLWAGQFEQRGTNFRLRESTRLVLPSRQAVEEYCARAIHRSSLEQGERLREAFGGEAFDTFGYGASAVPQLIGGSALTSQFLPLIPGPVTRQLYWQSYFEMSAKAFEAYNHDPITWRGVNIIEQFTLGKGLRSKVTKSTGDSKGQTHDTAQAAWDKFWQANRMDERLKKIARDIEIMGEQFIRYFPTLGDPKLIIRSLDPATIYDIVTDPEDHETVFFYHQQFQTPYQLYAPTSAVPPGGRPAPTGATQPGASTRYIIRQVDWREIDHYKINVGASERRGRSSIYPVLGWIKRLRDYMTSKVVQADMQARYAYDLTVNGTPGDVAKVRAALFPGNRPPAPGSVLGHSQAVSLDAVNFQGGSVGLASDQTFEALVNIVAVGLGVPKEYLGFQGKGSRAGALVATEPGAKRFEDAQETIRTILEAIAKRFFEAAGYSDAEIEFTFPTIASEERHQKLEDLAYAEGMGWISKQTSASAAAKELDIENYEFSEEQDLIASEFEKAQEDEGDEDEGTPPSYNPDGSVKDPGTPPKKATPKQGDGEIRRPMILASMRQEPKLDPTKAVSGMEDQPPGLLVPTSGGAVPGAAAGAGGGPPAATRGGMPANQNPMGAEGRSRIKTDLKVKENGEIEGLTIDGLAYLMREARGPRRRPDDPEFQQAGEAFRAQSARNLGELVKAHASGS